MMFDMRWDELREGISGLLEETWGRLSKRIICTLEQRLGHSALVLCSVLASHV